MKKTIMMMVLLAVAAIPSFAQTTIKVPSNISQGKGVTTQTKDDMQHLRQLMGQLKTACDAKDRTKMQQIAQQVETEFKKLPANLQDRIKVKNPKFIELIHRLASWKPDAAKDDAGQPGAKAGAADDDSLNDLWTKDLLPPENPVK